MKIAKILNEAGEWKDGVFNVEEPSRDGINIGDQGGEIQLMGSFYPHSHFFKHPSRNIHIGNSPIRIGFVGKMRSGKDTAADHLVRSSGGAIMKFAKPMYDIHDFAVARLGLKGKQRRLLQLLGTEWGRHTLGEDIWIDQLEKDLVNYPGSVYVSDCRFPNEAARLHKLGFVLVRVQRPDKARVQAGASSEEHESERYIDSLETDITLVNDSSLENFLAKVDEMALSLSYMGLR